MVTKKKDPKDLLKEGRKRTTTPPESETVKLGKELLEWLSKNKATHLSEWYSIVKMIPRSQWKAMTQVPEFLPFYEKALAIVAQTVRDGTINPSIAHRFLSLYHQDVREHEREEKEFEARLNENQNKLDVDAAAFKVLDRILENK